MVGWIDYTDALGAVGAYWTSSYASEDEAKILRFQMILDLGKLEYQSSLVVNQVYTRDIGLAVRLARETY